MDSAMARPTLLILSFLVTLAACGPVEDTRPGQPVAHRQAAFKELLKSFEPMGVMLREEQFDAKRFKTLSDQFLSRRDSPWQYFGPDTNYPPSKSRPEVWSDNAKFDDLRKEFLKAGDELAKAAETGDKTKVDAAYKTVYDSCKRCHKDFKDK